MSATPTSVQHPNPAIIFDTLNAYQRSAALEAGIGLDLFTETARQSRCVSDRQSRQRIDPLSTDSAMFLDRNSPAYFGSAALFMLDPRLIAPFLNLLQVVRAGTTTLPDEGTVSRDNPLWLDFANRMAPMSYPSAVDMADLVRGEEEIRVLDVAAGHGLFGLTVAQRNSKAQITALDWPNVPAVATKNAEKFGVADRHSTIDRGQS